MKPQSILWTFIKSYLQNNMAWTEEYKNPKKEAIDPKNNLGTFIDL